MNNLLKLKKNKKGFSVIEVVIYLSMLITVSVLVIQNIITLFKNYNIVKAHQEIESNAINILDKLNRDIKESETVVIDQSYFYIPQGVLVLNNATNTMKFSLDENKIKYYKNENYIGNISTKNVSVNDFKIYYISSTSTEAIRVDLGFSIQPHLSEEIINKNFHTTIQLRR